MWKIATVALIVLYKRFGALVAFGWDSGMALLAAILLLGVRQESLPTSVGE